MHRYAMSSMGGVEHPSMALMIYLPVSTRLANLDQSLKGFIIPNQALLAFLVS